MTKYEKLSNQLLKAVFNNHTPATNNKRVNQIAKQMRYMENSHKKVAD